jgi:hypothetical protein
MKTASKGRKISGYSKRPKKCDDTERSSTIGVPKTFSAVAELLS